MNKERMTKEQIIAQLESLREHCHSRTASIEPDSVWQADVEALDAAINALKGAE